MIAQSGHISKLTYCINKLTDICIECALIHCQLTDIL
nr:MAG TPA: hypothetical protein [Caudoviricetes sp.]